MEVHVGQRGEIVIPKSLRERFDIRPSSVLNIRVGLEGIELAPKKTKDLREDLEQRWARMAIHDLSTWNLSDYEEN